MKNTKHAKTSYRMLAPLLAVVDGTEDKYYRFESGGYMPLSIEALGYTGQDGNPVYSMMHWTTQNGDLMRDPDMTFSVNREQGTVHPLTFQNDFIQTYHEVYQRADDGRLLYSPRLLTELDDFLWRWLKNIKEQGYLAA